MKAKKMKIQTVSHLIPEMEVHGMHPAIRVASVHTHPTASALTNHVYGHRRHIWWAHMLVIYFGPAL